MMNEAKVSISEKREKSTSEDAKSENDKWLKDVHDAFCNGKISADYNQ